MILYNIIVLAVIIVILGEMFYQCFPSHTMRNTVNLLHIIKLRQTSHNPKRITSKLWGLCRKMATSPVNKGVNTNLMRYEENTK